MSKCQNKVSYILKLNFYLLKKTYFNDKDYNNSNGGERKLEFINRLGWIDGYFTSIRFNPIQIAASACKQWR